MCCTYVHIPVSLPSCAYYCTGTCVLYSAADGQHLYLHPINARCLMKEYESLEFAPESIKAKIVDVEQLGITEVGVLKYPKVY